MLLMFVMVVIVIGNHIVVIIIIVITCAVIIVVDKAGTVHNITRMMIIIRVPMMDVQRPGGVVITKSSHTGTCIVAISNATTNGSSAFLFGQIGCQISQRYFDVGHLKIQRGRKKTLESQIFHTIILYTGGTLHYIVYMWNVHMIVSD